MKEKEKKKTKKGKGGVRNFVQFGTLFHLCLLLYIVDF